MNKTENALKLALEYLRDNQHYIADNERHVYVMEYNAFVERLEALVEQPANKPLTDEQIMEMYNEPRSDAEMIAFARAIEAAHGIGEQK